MTFDECLDKATHKIDLLLAQRRAARRLKHFLNGLSDEEITDLMHGQRELDDDWRREALAEVRAILEHEYGIR